MDRDDALVEKAVSRLWPYRAIAVGDREIIVAYLLPVPLWRDVRATWWRGKSASLIAGDWNGNFFLRHCDGTVRYWSHSEGRDEVIAKSVREFIGMFKEPSEAGSPRWRDAT